MDQSSDSDTENGSDNRRLRDEGSLSADGFEPGSSGSEEPKGGAEGLVGQARRARALEACSPTSAESAERAQARRSKKSQRNRTSFSPKQIDALEREFEQTHYPDGCARESLAKQIGLPEARIQVWFSNRRAKFRREDKLRQPGSQRSSGAISVASTKMDQ